MRKTIPWEAKGRSRESGGIFLPWWFINFTCRSQTAWRPFVFSGCHVRSKAWWSGKINEVTCSVYLWISFSRGAGDAIPDTNKTSVVEASPFNVRLGALPGKDGFQLPVKNTAEIELLISWEMYILLYDPEVYRLYTWLTFRDNDHVRTSSAIHRFP